MNTFNKGQIVIVAQILNDGSYTENELNYVRSWAVGSMGIVTDIDTADNKTIYGIKFKAGEVVDDRPDYFFQPEELRLATLEEKIDWLIHRAIKYQNFD